LGVALFLICIWAFTGFFVNFSDTWQLIINTSTTILTFIIAISLQYTQNKDTKSLHLKLNKLISMNTDLKESLEEIEKELEDEE
jgi:low affinity Fe/Cu permease